MGAEHACPWVAETSSPDGVDGVDGFDGVGRFGLRQDVLRVYSRIFLRTRLDGPGVLVGEQEQLCSLEL